MVQLQSLLGRDNVAAKLFERFWGAWGHPPAFLTEARFLVSRAVHQLVKALDVYDDSPLLTVRERVRVVTQMSELRREVMALLEADELIKENIEGGLFFYPCDISGCS